MKTYNHLIITTSIIIYSILFHSCCIYKPNKHYHIPFKNNTTHSIYVDCASKEQYLAFPSYQDTILQPYYLDSSLDLPPKP